MGVSKAKSETLTATARRSLPSFHFGFIALTPCSYKSWSLPVRAKPCENQSFTQSLVAVKVSDFTSPNFRYTTLPAAFACRFSRRFIIAKNTGITTHVAAIHAVWSVKHTAVYPNLGITNMDIKPLANSSLKPAHIAIAL